MMAGASLHRGMRITVVPVVNSVANGMTFQETVRDYPHLEAEDVRQTLQYAALLAPEETYPLEEARI
jgi:uncharacterized protein (DUF433 family)